jgi:MFS family permease
MADRFIRDLQYYKFCVYGFLKNLRFFEPFLILFFLEKGLSYLEIGTLYAIKEIATNILEIPTGVAADSLGRRRTMVFSFGSYIVSFAVFYLSGQFAIFVAAMVLFSFGEAFRTGTHKAMIFEYLRINGWTDQKVHYYGHTRSWSQMGSALSALIAMGLVFFRGRYASIFLFSIIPYLLDLTLMLTYPRELDGTRRSVSGKKFVSQFTSVVKDFAYSFRDRSLLKSILNLALYTGYYKAAKDFLQPLLKSLALAIPILTVVSAQKRTAIVVGVVYSLIYVLTSLASRSAGGFTERFKSLEYPLNITMFIGPVLGIGAGILYALGSTVGAVILYVGIYLIENLRKPIGISYVSDKMRSDILATALSAESQVETIVAALVAVALGFFADRFGLANGLVAVSVLVGIAAIFAVVRKTQPVPVNDET